MYFWQRNCEYRVNDRPVLWSINDEVLCTVEAESCGWNWSQTMVSRTTYIPVKIDREKVKTRKLEDFFNQRKFVERGKNVQILCQWWALNLVPSGRLPRTMVHLDDNLVDYDGIFFYCYSWFLSIYLSTSLFYSSVYDTCFDPEGKHILATGGNHVLVYNAKDGSLIHTLKGKYINDSRMSPPILSGCNTFSWSTNGIFSGR